MRMKVVKFFVRLFTLVTVLRFTTGNSSGAPAGACFGLTPSHGSNTPQTTPSPYTITFSPTTFTPGGSPVTVTLSTSIGTTFMGFLLTTQYEESCVDQSLMPGTFTAPAGAQMTCSNGAVTHTSRNTQNSLSFQWTPPATSEGHIRFRATFVQSFTTFWVNVKASDLLMDSTVGASHSSCTTQGSSTAGPTGTLTKDPGCGSTKGCYSDCSGTDCKFLMTWEDNSSPDSVLITMSGKIGNTQNRYIAFGLSNDDKMGDDSVTYCINTADGVYSAYNQGRSNTQLANPKEGLGNISTSFQDGVLTCTFTRAIVADATGRFFALDKPYTIFWAEGPGSSAGIGIHNDIPLISTEAASLQDFTVDIGGAADYPLVKTHGSLMIIAWIFYASIGIVLARYFKNVWEDKMWCGQKIWFQIHRTCMILCLLATVTAFIIIFVEVGGYSDIQGEGHKKAHPIIGIIVTILTVINPIMAVFRPHPGTKNRPIFNWLHWAVGFGAYNLGVISIFFGMEMDKAGVPDYTIYILVAFVVWQAVIQILMEIVQCRGRNTERSDKYEMRDVNEQGSAAKSAAKAESSSIKPVLLAIHVLVVSGFTAALIVVLNIGEDED